MHQILGKKVAEWRDAESRARAAEKALTQSLFSEEPERSTPDVLVMEARLLRTVANEKLKAAIAAMRPTQ